MHCPELLECYAELQRIKLMAYEAENVVHKKIAEIKNNCKHLERTRWSSSSQMYGTKWRDNCSNCGLWLAGNIRGED